MIYLVKGAIMICMALNIGQAQNYLTPVYTNGNCTCTISAVKTSFSTHKQYLCELTVKQVKRENNYQIALGNKNFTGNIYCTILCSGWRSINIVEPDAFKGMEKVHMIYLYGNKISIIKAELFKGLNSLKKLMLARNRLHQIESGTFKYLSSLEILDLYFNQLENLHEEAFLGLKLLKHLDLNNNKLSRIKNGTFVDLNNLNILLLYHNVIQIIEKGTFNVLEHLTKLNLKSNKMTVLYSGMFAGLTKLRKLKLGHNAIHSIDKGAFVDRIHLRSNTIKFIGTVKLGWLILNNNKIDRLERGIFLGLIELHWLDLSYNNIHMVTHGVFNCLSSLRYLGLDHNKLTQITSNLTKGLINLGWLHLQSNKIVSVEQNVFMPILAVSETLEIDVRYNNISDLSWTVFLGSSNTQLISNQYYNLTLYIYPVIFKCSRSFCWMKHLDWYQIYTAKQEDQNGDFISKNEIKIKCNKILDQICPSEGNHLRITLSVSCTCSQDDTHFVNTLKKGYMSILINVILYCSKVVL